MMRILIKFMLKCLSNLGSNDEISIINTSLFWERIFPQRGGKKGVITQFMFLETQLELSISSPQYKSDHKSIF